MKIPLINNQKHNESRTKHRREGCIYKKKTTLESNHDNIHAKLTKDTKCTGNQRKESWRYAWDGIKKGQRTLIYIHGIGVLRARATHATSTCYKGSLRPAKKNLPTFQIFTNTRWSRLISLALTANVLTQIPWHDKKDTLDLDGDNISNGATFSRKCVVWVAVWRYNSARPTFKVICMLFVAIKQLCGSLIHG